MQKINIFSGVKVNLRTRLTQAGNLPSMLFCTLFSTASSWCSTSSVG